MNKIFFLLRGGLFGLFLTFAGWLQAQNVVGVYTDFGGYWSSSVDTVNTIRPNNVHNLLAFRMANGNIYATGVNDALLTSRGISFTARNYKALPVSNLPLPGRDTYIGVGDSYGGGAGNISPIPVTNNLSDYLVDGENGLALGTGIYNLPASTEIYYNVASFRRTSIGDGVPDIVITQMGQVTAGRFDVFRMVNASGATVGRSISVDFSTVPFLATGSFKFYNPQLSGATPTYNASLRGPRNLRLLAYDFADFGITTTNYTNVQRFSQRFSGVSDQAFIAYNATALRLLQPISGTVIDSSIQQPTPTGYEGAVVTLLNNQGTIVERDTSDALGFYAFDNLVDNNYTVELATPSGYNIINAPDGGTDSLATVVVDEDPVTGVDFTIQNTALDVSFGSIEATVAGDELQVKWETLREENNAYFDVQVSPDGKEFTTASRIDTKARGGNSSVKINYSAFIDLGAGTTWAGLFLLGIIACCFSIFSRGKTIASVLLIAFLSMAGFACKKGMERIPDADQQLLIRIVQTDKDGSQSQSKVVQAKHS